MRATGQNVVPSASCAAVAAGSGGDTSSCARGASALPDEERCANGCGRARRPRGSHGGPRSQHCTECRDELRRQRRAKADASGDDELCTEGCGRPRAPRPEGAHGFRSQYCIECKQERRRGQLRKGTQAWRAKQRAAAEQS
jgi:hypothetical protein